MKGLLWKDACLMKGQIKFLLLVLFITVFLSINSDGMFAMGYLVMIAAILGISMVSYDEMDNGYGFLFCLPVSRRQYVREKYLFNLGIGGLAWLAGFVITAVVEWMKADGMGMTEILYGNFIFIPVILLVQAVVLPVVMKFGGERGRVILRMLFGGVAAVWFIMEKILDMADISLTGMMEHISRFSVGILEAVLVAAAVAIVFVSISVSTRIMEKKEF